MHESLIDLLRRAAGLAMPIERALWLALHDHADADRWWHMARATLLSYWRGQTQADPWLREQDWVSINSIDPAEQRLLLERCAAYLEAHEP